MKKKAQIWISAILFMLVISVTLTIVLSSGKPIIENLQDKTVFTRQKNLFLSLDQNIRDIASEGQGSQRVVPVEIEKGSMKIEDGTMYWVFRTEANILESGREVDLGNVHISSNADVFTSENDNAYVLGNTFVKYQFYKCEEASCKLNSSNILQAINFTDPETGQEHQSSGAFGMEFGSGVWENVTGYSELLDSGSSLGSAAVRYYINSSSSNPTILEFTLGSYTDFIEAKIR